MPYKYVVVCSVYMNGEMSTTRFGIAAVDERDGTTIPFQTIADLSSDFNRVEELVNTCNSLQLDFDHLDDVVEDFLYTV